MASRISCSAASAVPILSPENPRTAAIVSKSSGSPMSMVSVESSKRYGMKRHCRIKRDPPKLGVEQFGLVALHQNLVGHAAPVFLRTIEQRDPDDDLLMRRNLV